MTVRASQNFKLLFKIFIFIRTIHVFSFKGCYMPKFWVQNRTSCLWLLWAELPRNSFISVWLPHVSYSALPFRNCCLDPVLWRVFLKKKVTNRKTPCASFWPKCLEHGRRWSQPRHTASREFRFGNLFAKVGKHNLPETKPPITEETERCIFFKNTLSSELKFTLFRKVWVCPGIGRMIFLWAVGFGSVSSPVLGCCHIQLKPNNAFFVFK